jgi:hypothetical protein
LKVLRFSALIGVVAFISACQESLIQNEQEVALKKASRTFPENYSSANYPNLVEFTKRKVQKQGWYMKCCPDRQL